MHRIWLRLTRIPASLAAWASALSVHRADPSPSRATIVPSACTCRCPGSAPVPSTWACAPLPRGRRASPATPRQWCASGGCATFRMAVQLGRNLIRHFPYPTQKHHLGKPFPIRRGVVAVCQFPHHAFFLLILRCSRFHVLGHLLAPSSSEHFHLIFYH